MSISDELVNLFEAMDDNLLVIRSVVLLGASIGGDGSCPGSMPPALEEFFEDASQREIDQCMPGMPSSVFDGLGAHRNSEQFQDAYTDLWSHLCAQNRLGFLVRFSRPICKKVGKSGTLTSFSWGYARRLYVYDDTIEGAIRKALDALPALIAKDEQEESAS